MSLLARTFPTATVRGTARDDLSWLAQAPPSDVYVPMGSLPLYLRPTLGSFPTRGGYLVPDVTRLVQYRQRLTALGPGLKVGIAWRSLAARRHDPCYTTLAQWKALLTVPGVHFVNLQYDQADAEVAAAEASFGVPIHSWDDLDSVQRFRCGCGTDGHPRPDYWPGDHRHGAGGMPGTPGVASDRFRRGGHPWGRTPVPGFRVCGVLHQRQYGPWNDILAQMAHDVLRLAHERRCNAPQ